MEVLLNYFLIPSPWKKKTFRIYALAQVNVDPYVKIAVGNCLLYVRLGNESPYLMLCAVCEHALCNGCAITLHSRTVKKEKKLVPQGGHHTV